MSLYVRVSTGFWTHRKTMRLCALLGIQYAYLPVRLWCYAAENQPDGCFEKYLPDELAMLLGYSGDSQAMLQAMQQAGFMDGMKIHDWEEHNSYHEKYAERARNAARARWEKERQERKGKETSNASSINTEKKDVFPTSERALKIAALFKRRPTTAWDEREIKSFRNTAKHPDEDFSLLMDYYENSKSPFLRKDLGTFLNNFTTELDRARAWKNGNGKPSLPTAAEIRAKQAAMDAEVDKRHAAQS